MEDRISFRFLLVTDRINYPEIFFDKLENAISAGVGAVQLREKGLAGASFLQIANRVSKMTSKQNIPLIINDRVDVAIASRSQGVHLPANSFPTAIVRKSLVNSFLVSQSTHDPDEVLTAEKNGADYVTFGPIFETSSKMKYGSPLGIEILRELCQRTSIPVFAIGGITLSTVKPVIDAGAHGIAVISAVFDSQDVSDTVSHFREELN